ncbi:rhodanese-like domain-containing protein [Neptunicella marina]|uniref:Rhodanese-like domain-containing protein n=1 Tax=Neptunicella marina TaxID=2125989 RepID=A0A8J6IXA1_9ALTE|nr:rhodanese-like domain-containing protein [Neptunicella marina]MBC3767028.1 rhodanese-like domain-containing protein [Neptunicella marina]
MQQFIEFIGNHYWLAGAWVALFFAIVFGYISANFSAVKEISTHDATLLINKQDAVVVDIRPNAEFKKGHILGAKNLKSEQVQNAEFTSLEKHKNTPIIVVCAMGMTAKKTAAQMLKAGFSQVNVLKGGMNTWVGANLPVSK